MVTSGVGKKNWKIIVVDSVMGETGSVVWPSVAREKVRFSWKQIQEQTPKNGIYANRRKPSSVVQFCCSLIGERVFLHIESRTDVSYRLRVSSTMW